MKNKLLFTLILLVYTISIVPLFAISADNMYYTYDANGNIINERIDRQATKEELDHDIEIAEGVYSLDYGIALPNQPDVETKEYSRTYIWNEKNQLKSSVENGLVVQYRYGEDGQRAVKSSLNGETLYFNNMWQMSTTAMGMRQTKHIFVGETRIATKNNWWQDASTDYEKYNTYFYHSDHLGSAQLITDYKGQEYERIEYTPYGELWIEKVRKGFETINYRFTGKEMDSETGLYYFGARYLDSKYSRWLSTDPALQSYIPQGNSSQEYKVKEISQLPGMGGIYNTINSHLYHYAGNNPVKYTDPDGEALHIAVGAGIGALVGGLSTIATGGSLRDIAAATVGGAVTGGMAAATCGMSLGATIAGSAMAGTAGYLAESMVAGNQATIEGAVLSGLSGAIGAMAGAVVDKAINTGAAKVSQASQSAKGFDNWLNKGESNNTVYFGIKKGEAQYTGITKQPLDTRLNQHNTNGKGFSRLEPISSGLTRNQARSIEQYYIENGPNDLNKINSISPNNKYYEDAMKWAKNYLGE